RLSAVESTGEGLRRADVVPETLRGADAVRIPPFSPPRTPANDITDGSRRRFPSLVTCRLRVRGRRRAGRSRRAVYMAITKGLRFWCVAHTPCLGLPFILHLH